MNDKENGPEAGDLVDDIYDVAPVHSDFTRKEFKPWHHPRKHWVRIHQLCKLSQTLFSETHFPDKVVRYLTLPGEELLDIQALEGIFNRSKGPDLKLKYLGFNNINQDQEKIANSALAENTLKNSNIINGSSQIIKEQIQNIANTNSLAYSAVKKNGPFNIINLDLCTSIANTPPDSTKNTYFDAIGQILNLQRLHMTEPFLMFIATRSEPQDIDPKSLKNIVQVYGENFKNNQDFKRKFEEIMEDNAINLLDKISSGKNVPQDILNKVFGVGLGKWLLHLMKPNAPHWDVSLEDICCYSIGDYKSNMLSLAFKFTKVQQTIDDSYGLFRNSDKDSTPKVEGELAMAMLNKAISIIDIDNLLKNSKDQRDKLIKQAGSLLKKSGYSAEEYTIWANNFFMNDENTVIA